MNKVRLAPDNRRRRYSRWLHLVLAGVIGFGMGVGQGVATADDTLNKPIITKSGKRAALKDAAEAILQQAGTSLQAAPTSLKSAPVLQALPTSTVDETAVPHYFGPFPNWATSPLTWPDATVTIDPPTGPGTTATATATVGANGAVTGITITNPGSGYSPAAAPGVTITALGRDGISGTVDDPVITDPAIATASVTASGAVTSVTVAPGAGGAGYRAPQVDITDLGGTGTGATATAYGGVDAVVVGNAGGSGYTQPTVYFDLPDGPNGVPAVGHAVLGDNGAITAIIVDQAGSGYSFAPHILIVDGTLAEPINNAGSGATATATLTIQEVAMDTFGSGYTNPQVGFIDPSGTGATATAATDSGAVTNITVTANGSGYFTPGGIKKFVDTLPKLCDPTAASGPLSCAAAANNLGQYLPLAKPDTTTFPDDPDTPDVDEGADYYVIAVVQQRECMSSSLPGCGTTPPTGGTLHRKYVQLSTPALLAQQAQLGAPIVPVTLDTTDLLVGTAPLDLPPGVNGAVTDPHYLGPVILARKDRPVRITFYNLLPTEGGGNLILPSDSTLMGAGFGPLASNWPETPAPGADLGLVTDAVRNPVCTQDKVGPDYDVCYKDNRATLHLHGGLSPWISDGTPHQWITPDNEIINPWPQGDGVSPVPDMSDQANVPDCAGEDDGCMTFYYTNQQSARLMFYHDHAFGTTRLNVYLGEAAGYVIQDTTEDNLVASGTIPDLVDTIPLIIQDRTFAPDPTQLAAQDPTWDYTRWGSHGDFWYHHVYMPAQNPGDPSGMSAYGRWMYGPWFWPPADPPHGPIPNPYFNMDPKGKDGIRGTADDFDVALAQECNLNDPLTWQYETDPFCEPPLIPGTPNISAGMEQFNDTPLVNGTAYPTLTVEPKAYRFRVLNAANDRFMNLSLYVADQSSEVDPAIGPTEVALNPAELAAAQLDPVVFPTPDTSVSPPGPSWIQIGTEGGFLPAPVVVPPQPTTWITDPTRFDVGNADKHSLLLAPAERADVIVDFSKFRNKTLIVYNDAPAAFPARVPSYDYYTGAPDMYPNGAPPILPGYGPNTRTVMQIKVSDVAPAPTFNLNALRAAFRSHIDGSGVFESGQHPIIVGQGQTYEIAPGVMVAPYNSAYGTDFVAGGYCNDPNLDPLDPAANLCDGFLRIVDQGGDLFGFNTLLLGTQGKLEIPIEPKAIHDEMNSATFDEFGRMTANMGLTIAPASAANLNLTLYPYVNPTTEIIDGTLLPQSQAGVDITPITSATDGTQIWKITHNGVDTHPLHFHLYDVQLLNRVAWDNIISPPDATELGWKDTVRVNPLQDTIVALRPIIPDVPFPLPNSIRLLNPALPLDSTIGFNNTDAAGDPTAAIQNRLVNYGWEYVWHCHILSHEEMDMMRPQSLALPPNKPDGLVYALTVPNSVQLTWNDTSLNETEFVVQKKEGVGAWVDLQQIVRDLGAANDTGVMTVTDNAWNRSTTTSYQIVAKNRVGYGGQFMSLTTQSVSDAVVIPPPPVATVTPIALKFPDQAVGTTSAPLFVTLSNTGGSDLISTFKINGANLTDFAQTNACGTVAPGASCVISVTFTPSATGGRTATLRISTNDPFNLAPSVRLTGTGVVPPAAPSVLTGSAVRLPLGADGRGDFDQVTLRWTDNSNNEAGFRIQRAQSTGGCNGPALVFATVGTVGANVTTYRERATRIDNLCYRVQAFNAAGDSAWSNVLRVVTP